MTLANVAIFPNDGLPTAICLSCIDRLENCIEFVEQCEKSDQYLRSTCIDIVNVSSSINDKNDISEVNKRNNSVIICQYTSKKKCDKSLAHEFSIDNDTEIKHNTDIFEKENIMKSENNAPVNDFISIKNSSPYTYWRETIFLPSLQQKLFTSSKPQGSFEGPYGEKPFHCAVCGETFAHSAGLAVHRRKHTGQKPYQCILCPRNFRTVGHLQYHIRRHTGAKNFECSTCGRAFITRSDLKQHLVTHSGEKSHVCCICGTRMTRASHLKRHIRIIHGDGKGISKDPKREKEEDKCVNDNIDNI